MLLKPEKLQIEVAGVPRESRRLPARPLEGWDHSYRLALGNEPTGDRSWVGEIRRTVVQTESTRLDNAQPGMLEIPLFIWYRKNIDFVPFLGLDVADAVADLLGFVPLRFSLVATRHGKPRSRLLRAVLLRPGPAPRRRFCSCQSRYVPLGERLATR